MASSTKSVSSSMDGLGLSPKPITPYQTPIKPAQEAISKTSQIKDPITPQIFEATSVNKIAEIKNSSIKKKVSYALAFFIFSGIIVATIGLGGLLPHLGVDPQMAIPGISEGLAEGLLAGGGALALAWPALLIASKIKSESNTSKLLKDYYKDFNKIRSKGFIDSNLNDLIGIAAYALLAITITLQLSPDLSQTLGITQGCLNYPFGFLLLGSGVYQLFVSINEFKNACQSKDKEKITKQLINIINSALIIGLGLLAIGGLMNNPLSIGANILNGGLSLGLGLYTFLRYSIKNYRKIKTFKGNDINSIYQYLDETLKISSEKAKEIKEKYSKFNKESIIKWINENKKYFNEAKKAEWEKLKTQLELATDAEIKEDQFIKIREQIIREEIKNATDSNLEDFRSLVNEDTFKKAINNYKILSALKEKNLSLDLTDENRSYIKSNFPDLDTASFDPKANFKTIKSEILSKIIGETVKLIMFAGFTVVSSMTLNTKLTGTSCMSDMVYDYSVAGLSVLSLGTGLVPRFRNVPPDLEKNPFEVNNENLPVIPSNAERNAKAVEIARRGHEKIDNEIEQQRAAFFARLPL